MLTGFIGLASRLSMFPPLLCIWTPRSTLTSPSPCHMVEADLTVLSGSVLLPLPRRRRMVMMRKTSRCTCLLFYAHCICCRYVIMQPKHLELPSSLCQMFILIEEISLRIKVLIQSVQRKQYKITVVYFQAKVICRKMVKCIMKTLSRIRLNLVAHSVKCSWPSRET